MASEEEINDQKELLQTYRRTLALLLKQRASLTDSYIPPHLASGIRDARNNIRRIKTVLKGWNTSIADHPDDEEASYPDDTPVARAANNRVPTNIVSTNKRSMSGAVARVTFDLQSTHIIEYQHDQGFITQVIHLRVDGSEKLRKEILPMSDIEYPFKIEGINCEMILKARIAAYSLVIRVGGYEVLNF